MFSSTATTNPFGQSTSSPFGSQSVFEQNNNANNNPFTPKPFGGTSPFGAQTGGSLFGGTSTGVFGAAQSSSPLASTPTFGASSSPAFGASSTPSFGSSVFGQKPAFGGFGSSPTQTAPFGSTAQQTQPAFGSNLFGSSTPFGASSQPSFGATSTPAFGTSSTPAFGVMSSPAFGSTGTPAFGYTTPAFGSTGTTFGASSAPAFGSGGAFGVSSTPAFGSSTTPSFGASSTPAFGSSSTSVFGGSSTSAFGNASSPSFSFGQSGSAFGSSQFGTTPSPFGSQNSSGSQPTTPSFGNSGFGTSSIGAQRVGSRVVGYTSTVEADGGTGKLVSLSAMPAYKEKSHEELRWEDYQSGNKGGPSPAGQSAGGVGFGAPAAQSNPFGAPAAQSNPFGAPAAQSNPFGATPTFGQSSSNPFSSTTSSNQNASSTPGFGASSSPAFGSSPFGLSQTTNLFGTTQNTNPFSATSASTQSIFGASSTPAFGASSSSLFGASSSPAFGSSPSIFGSASAPATTSAFGSATLNFGNTQSAGLPTTPSLGQTNSAFGKTTSTFGQSTAPSFGQSNLFNATSSGFGGNLFSSNSTPSTLSTSNQVGFGQTTPSLSAPFQPAQSAQALGAMSFGNFGQTQAASSGFGGSSIFGQGTFGQSPANQGPTAVQPMPLANPFGTLPAVPQMSIGRSGSSPSIQYGISSMPVTHKPAPVRVSSLLTSRHLSQRRIRLPARKCHPKCDVPKVPFYSDYEEEPSTPKADALYIPRENPRALMIHPAEKWSAKANMEKPILSKDTYTPVHKNGGPTEYGSDKTHFVKNNQKQNGCHEEHHPTQKVDSYITLTGHRAGEAAIVYEHGADIEALMPKLKHADYYTEPRIQELAAKERSESGFCQRVKDFVVGRHGYGSIKFIGETDVRRLDLEALVQFNNREVIVYMDDNKKPPVGQGLNKPADVTLLNIKCFDKKTGQQYTEGPKVDKYKEVLAKKARDQGAEFVSYDPLKGEWKFMVNHFSKYNLLDEDDEGCLVVS